MNETFVDSIVRLLENVDIHSFKVYLVEFNKFLNLVPHIIIIVQLIFFPIEIILMQESMTDLEDLREILNRKEGNVSDR